MCASTMHSVAAHDNESVESVALSLLAGRVGPA